jgi:hypothetical protein
VLWSGVELTHVLWSGMGAGAATKSPLELVWAWERQAWEEELCSGPAWGGDCYKKSP